MLGSDHSIPVLCSATIVKPSITQASSADVSPSVRNVRKATKHARLQKINLRCVSFASRINITIKQTVHIMARYSIVSSTFSLTVAVRATNKPLQQSRTIRAQEIRLSNPSILTAIFASQLNSVLSLTRHCYPAQLLLNLPTRTYRQCVMFVQLFVYAAHPSDREQSTLILKKKLRLLTSPILNNNHLKKRSFEQLYSLQDLTSLFRKQR